MIEKLIKELEKDKSEGSYYHAWQSNIAMAFVDEYEINKNFKSIGIIANDAAKVFLDRLIGTATYKCKQVNKLEIEE